MALTAFKLGKEQEIMTTKKKSLLKKSSTNQRKFHGGPGWLELVSCWSCREPTNIPFCSHFPACKT